MKKLWRHFDEVDFDLNFNECGIEQYTPRRFYDYTVYQNYIIHYIYSGKGYFTFDNKDYTLSKGDGFIIKRGDKIKQYADYSDPWEYYWIGISGTYLEKVLYPLTKDGNRVINFKQNSPSATIIKAICHYALEKNDPFDEYIYFKYKLYELLYEMHQEFINEFYTSTNDFYNLTEQVKKIISERYMHPLKVSSIAEELNVNRSHLYRVFKKNTGTSIQKFIIETRLGIAGQQLKFLDLTVRDIALNVGYSDPLLFSRIFKREYGYTPTEYRELHKYEKLY